MQADTKQKLATLGGILAAEAMAYVLSDPDWIGVLGNGKAATFFSELSKYALYATTVPAVGCGIKGALEKYL